MVGVTSGRSRVTQRHRDGGQRDIVIATTGVGGLEEMSLPLALMRRMWAVDGGRRV